MTKIPIFGVHDSQGSAETLVRRGGITNYHLISYSVSNISAKNYQNRLMCIEVIVCNVTVVFFRHSVENWHFHQWIVLSSYADSHNSIKWSKAANTLLGKMTVVGCKTNPNFNSMPTPSYGHISTCRPWCQWCTDKQYKWSIYTSIFLFVVFCFLVLVFTFPYFHFSHNHTF